MQEFSDARNMLTSKHSLSAGVLKSTRPFTKELIQTPEMLKRSKLKDEFLSDIRRYIDTEEAIYEFTTDPDYLNQYYDVRQFCYRQGLGLEGFSGAEDRHDREGQILVARCGDKVIGGARINASTPECRVPLVLEEDNFNMPRLFPELSLVDKSYCEFSRLVLLPEYRIGNYLYEIIDYITRRSIECDYQYLFTVSPLVQARAYRKIYHRMGLDYEIISRIKVPCKPIYGGIKMCLSKSVLFPKCEDRYGLN